MPACQGDKIKVHYRKICASHKQMSLVKPFASGPKTGYAIQSLLEPSRIEYDAERGKVSFYLRGVDRFHRSDVLSIHETGDKEGYAYIKDVLTRLPTYRSSNIAALLPRW